MVSLAWSSCYSGVCKHLPMYALLVTCLVVVAMAGDSRPPLPKKNGLLMRAREHRWKPQGGRYGKRANFLDNDNAYEMLDGPVSSFYTDNMLCESLGYFSLFRCHPKRSVYGVSR